MEYWSVGVLRQVRIAPLGRGGEGAVRAAELELKVQILNRTKIWKPAALTERISVLDVYLGLKPQA